MKIFMFGVCVCVLLCAGVGDIVPTLSERNGAQPAVEEEEEEEGGEKEGKEDNEQGQGEEERGHTSGHPETSACTPQPTPSRPSSNRSSVFRCPSSVPRSVSHNHLGRPAYYQGLESPAAVQWMMQSQKKKKNGRTTVRRREASQSPVLPEEVLRLQHRVRVLEKSLLNEQSLSQEVHAALCQREREMRELEASHQRALVMAERTRELSDVQDELQMVNKELERSEKNVQRLRRELEEKQTIRDRTMEEKALEMNRLETENAQLKEVNLVAS